MTDRPTPTIGLTCPTCGHIIWRSRSDDLKFGRFWRRGYVRSCYSHWCTECAKRNEQAATIKAHTWMRLRELQVGAR